jgi:hypothetical protein
MAALAWNAASFALITGCIWAILAVPRSHIFLGRSDREIFVWCCIALMGATIFLKRRMVDRRVHASVLEVTCFGLRWNIPHSPPITRHWAEIFATDSNGSRRGDRETVLFVYRFPILRERRFFKLKIELKPADFQANWRTNDLGRFLQMFAPQSVGFTKIDPEGGSIAY